MKIDPNKIFIDTSAWIEFILSGEKNHKEIYNYLVSQVKKGAKFFTSDYVLDETYTRLLTSQSWQATEVLKEKIKELEEARELLVLWTDKVLFNKAWNYFKKFSEHKLSFTDATIFTYVKDLKLDEVLSLDQGFKKVGLTVKPALY